MPTYISPIPNDALSSLCEEIKKNSAISGEYFERFDVKRGLRNRDGSGVMAGLSKICSVEGYYIADGERTPIDGKLIYRGIDLNDIVSGCRSENRFGYEEVSYLLLFGTLPTKEQLDNFKKMRYNIKKTIF